MLIFMRFSHKVFLVYKLSRNVHEAPLRGRMVLPIAVAPGFLNQAKKVEIRAQRRTLSLAQHHSAHSVLVQLGLFFSSF
ncbi:hypothetical protein E4V51_16135 [Paenibacillus sp. 28ISP30-2]|nr:hypothetical protein [Paenibacillus sp. 28ISP30-2]